MNTTAILQKRRRDFRREAAAYWRDIGRSGFVALIVFALIAGSYYYGKWLNGLPAGFPYWRIAVPVLLPFLAVSPIRTYLREADTVFLLPAERGMGPYFRGACLRSFAVQALLMVPVLAAVWPLYARSSGGPALPFAAAVLYFAALKALGVLASWQESRFVYDSHRRLFRFIRWLMTLTAVYVFFRLSPLAAVAAAGLLAAAAWAIQRPLSKYVCNWTYLIQQEKDHLNRHYAFYSWFADVPLMRRRPHARLAAAAAVRRAIPFASASGYFYLYALTFLRTEAFGIYARTTAAAAVCLILFTHPAAAAFICGAAILLTGVQVSSLEQSHAYSFWPLLYPLPPGQRETAVRRIVLLALVLQTLVLSAAAALGLPRIATALWILAAGIAYACLYSMYLLKKRFRKRSLEL